MPLLRLFNEPLLGIASNFKYESDINALLRVTGRLYYLLSPFLYQFNARFYKGSAFKWAFENDVASAAQKATEAGALGETIVIGAKAMSGARGG